MEPAVYSTGPRRRREQPGRRKTRRWRRRRGRSGADRIGADRRGPLRRLAKAPGKNAKKKHTPREKHGRARRNGSATPRGGGTRRLRMTAHRARPPGGTRRDVAHLFRSVWWKGRSAKEVEHANPGRDGFGAGLSRRASDEGSQVNSQDRCRRWWKKRRSGTDLRFWRVENRRKAAAYIPPEMARPDLNSPARPAQMDRRMTLPAPFRSPPVKDHLDRSGCRSFIPG